MTSHRLQKILSLLLVLAMCFSMLPVSAFADDGMDEEAPEEQGHLCDYTLVVTEPSCTEPGYTTYVCSECGDSYTADDVPALGHSPTAADEIPATCAAAGQTAGSVCAVCGEVLEGCEPIDPLAHTPAPVEEVPSTCTVAGHTAGSVCAVCGEVLEGCEELPLAEHTPAEVEEVPATCTETGRTAGTVCAVCGEVLEGCEELPLAEHTPVDAEEIPARFGVAGRKAGKVCSVCGEVLEGCEEIPALDVEPVLVHFEVEELEDLSGLTVFTAEGVGCTPVWDEEQAAFRYADYLLYPGEYTYSFHDTTGLYDDVASSPFTVEAGEGDVVMALKLVKAPVFTVYSDAFINPLYADVVSLEELPAADMTEAELKDAFSELDNLILNQKRYDAVNITLDSAVAELREGFKSRKSVISIYYKAEDGADWHAVATELLSYVFVHTGVSTEGDYLSFTYGGVTWDGGERTTEAGKTFLFNYHPSYYTNAEQENALTVQVNSILSELSMDGMSDYEKLQAIYNYLVTHITYDDANLNNSSYKLKYTAYAALINNTAVCQGISNAFYRLSLEAGVDARIITSVTQCHAWNIACCDDSYYELDATWDLGVPSQYRQFFLKGSDSWLSGHTLDNSYSTLGDEFDDPSFNAYYAIPPYDYDPDAGQPDTPGSGEAHLNARNFPDTTFRGYLEENFDTDQDGVLSQAELDAVTEIYVNDMGLRTLKGLAFFPNLAKLECYGNYLTALDVSQNPELTYLNIGADIYNEDEQQWYHYWNDLTTLDVSHNEKLQMLVCAHNYLRSLDLSHNSQLGNVSCFDNDLTSLILPQSETLHTLTCSQNKLTSLDVSALPHLKCLRCTDNQLQGLSLSQNPELVLLECGGNPLSSLSLVNNSMLEDLRLYHTQISSLDLSNLSQLTFLACWGNPNLSLLDVSHCPNLCALDVPGNGFSSLDVSACPQLVELLTLEPNPYTTLDGTPAIGFSYSEPDENGWYHELCVDASMVPNGLFPAPGLAINAACFPDDNFRSYVSSTLDTDHSGGLSEAELAAVNNIDVSYLDISDLTGLEYFPQLRQLNCEGNDLYVLDVSRNPELRALNINSPLNDSDPERSTPVNHLTALDLSKNTMLERLSCARSRLTALDLSKNTKLVYLNCDENQLQALDLSKLTALMYFSCSGNQLSSLNTAANTNLISLFANRNQLSSLNLAKNTTLQQLGVYSNQLTQLNLTANKQLFQLCVNYNSLGTLDLSQNTALRSIVAEDCALSSLLLGNLSELTYLNVLDNQLAALDLSKTPNLTTLLAARNPLTALDLRPCAGLIKAVREGTSDGEGRYQLDDGYMGVFPNLWVNADVELVYEQTAALDASVFPDALFRAYVMENLDTNLDMRLTQDELDSVTELVLDDMAVSSLKGIEFFQHLNALVVHSAKLTTLDLGQNVDLNILDVRNCKLTALDPSHNLELEYLVCSGNQLTTLNTSYNTRLKLLDCSNNQLTNLALNSPDLFFLDCTGNKLTHIPIYSCSLLSDLVTSPELERTIENGKVFLTSNNVSMAYDASAMFMFMYGGFCGTNLTWSLDYGLLTIAGTGAMTNFTAASPAPWSFMANQIESVFISSGVTSIGTLAFDGCANLREVMLTGNMPTIAADAFNGVTATVTYPATSSTYTPAKMQNYGGSLTWQPEGGFSIRYDLNGGYAPDGAEELYTPITKPFGVTVNLSSAEPERLGYTFLGWAATPTATSAAYKPGAEFREDKDVTLYAVWKGNAYSVIFNANSEYAAGAMTAQTFTFGKAAALKANAFKRDGYAMVGWAFEPGAYTPEFTDKQSVADLPALHGDAEASEVTLYAVWKPLADSLDLRMLPWSQRYLDNWALVSNTAQSVDMFLDPTVQLRVDRRPEESYDAVLWKSSTPAVALVDNDGLVRFLKPGSATITASATDGSKLSVTVKFDVYYRDPSAKLTAALEPISAGFGVSTVPGLQLNDSAQLCVYGADKDQPMDPALFDYAITTRGGEAFLSLDALGNVRALEVNKTVAVKISLRDDPLKRSATVNVKTIPVQTAFVSLKPTAAANSEIWYTTADGELVDNPAEAAAIYVLKSGAARTIELVPSAADAAGASLPIAKGKFTYASSSTSVASVAEVAGTSSSVIARVTIKANASGAVTLTATSKDLAKTSGSIDLHVVDYAPRTDVTKVTMDTFKSGCTAEVPLICSYGSSIYSVEFFDDGYDKIAKHYTGSSGRIVVDNTWDSNGTFIVSLAPTVGIPSATIKGELHVTTDHGVYWLPLDVVCKSTLPTITVKQTGTPNVFYTDARGSFNIYSNTAYVTNAWLESPDFDSSWSPNMLYFGFNSELGNPKPAAKATIWVELAGYAFPVRKDVTIATTNKINWPLKLSTTSGTVNLETGSRVATTQVVQSSGGYPWSLDGYTVWTDSSFADVSIGALYSGVVNVSLRDGVEKGGKLTIYLQDTNTSDGWGWTAPIALSYTLNVTRTKPTLTPVQSTLTLNTLFPDGSSWTALKSNQQDTDLFAFAGTLETTSAAAQGKIEVAVDSSSQISARFTEEHPSVPNGSYVFSYKPEGAASAVKVTVKVINTLPTATLKPATVSIGGFNNQYCDTAQVTLSGNYAGITELRIAAVGKNAAEAEEILSVEPSAYGAYVAFVSVRWLNDEPPARAGTYTYDLTPVLENDVELKPLRLTVKVTDDRYKMEHFPLPASVTLNSHFPSSMAYHQIMFNNDIENVELSYVCTNAALAAEAEKITIETNYYNNDNSNDVLSITTSLRDDIKPGSYPFKVQFILYWPDGRKDIYQPLNHTVKVVNTLPKVTLSATTLTLNRDLDLTGYVPVSLPEEYRLVGFQEIMDGSYANLDFVDLWSSDDMLYARLTDAGRAAAKNADYKVTLTPVIENYYGDEAACAPVTLTVKNTSAKTWSVAVTPSGTLDPVQRYSDSGRLTYTVTKMTGVQGVPVWAELVGTNAELFQVGSITLNEKGQPYVQISLRDDVTYLNNTSYAGMKLRFYYETGNGDYIPVLSQAFTMKTSQSAVKFAAEPAKATFFQSQNKDRHVSFEVKMTAPADATFSAYGVSIGDIKFWQNALRDQAEDITVESIDAVTVRIDVTLRYTAKLVPGKTYTLPLLLRPDLDAPNVAPVKLSLSLVVKP